MRKRSYHRRPFEQHKLETGSTIRITLHYRSLGLLDGWSHRQVVKLCKLLNFTEYELSCITAIQWKDWVNWRRRDQFPSHVALTFKKWESWYWSQVKGVPEPPIEPVHLLVK